MDLEGLSLFILLLVVFNLNVYSGDLNSEYLNNELI